MLSTKADFTQYSLKRLEEEAQALNLDWSVFRPDELLFSLSSERQIEIYNNAGERLPSPSALFVKMGSSTVTSSCLALMRALEVSGHPKVVNPTLTYDTLGNKWQVYLSALRAKLPVAQTFFVASAPELEFAKDKLGLPFVLKEIHGARGESVSLIDSSEKFDQSRLLLLDGKHEFVAQQYLKTSHGRDIRVLVVGGVVQGAIERCAQSGGFLANVSKGGDARALTVDDSMLAISNACIDKFGLAIGGIDLLYGPNGYVLCEVNLGAQFVGFEQATQINIAQKILKSLIN